MPTTKTERLDARLTTEQKDTLEQAAALLGNTVSGFVVQAALSTAHEVLHRERLLVLGARDSQALADALADPPAPTAALRRAAERYRQRVDSL